MYDYFTNLQDYLASAAKNNPDHIAIIYGDERMTYSMLERKSQMFAAELQTFGVNKNDRIILQATNSLDSIIAFWGILMVAATVVIVAENLNEEKLHYIANDCEAIGFVGVGHSVLNKSKTKLKFAINTMTAIANKVSYKRPLSLLDIDLACIIYTSGSTGEPKGVMLSHRNMLAASTSINQYLEHNDNDVILSVLPLSFDYGLYQMIMAISVGATLVLEKNFLLPLQFLKKIETHKVTVIPFVPTMILMLRELAEKYYFNTNTVRCVTNTAAALNFSHIDALRVMYPQAKIFSMYGVTECKRCTYLPPEFLSVKPNSVGIAIPNTEVWIVDEHGSKLGPQKVGQLVVRGATVMQGYWNKPQLTQEKLRPGLLPNEKILYTGDYCSMDEEGFVYFHSRMDEMLKIRGMKVSPKEIEELVLKIDGVKEAVVVSAEYRDELKIYLFITLKIQYRLNEIEAQIFSKLKGCFKPEKIILLENLPKSHNGKYDKLKLKEMLNTKLVA